jgi:hypothetical protein
MRLLLPCFLFLFPSFLHADEPCRSGLQANQRPGPYSAQVAVGPQRGQQHCFICEAADKPIVIVFARQMSDPLGKLVHKLDKALEEHKAAELKSWVTFLSEDPTALDPKVVQWSKQHSTGNVPLAIFNDEVGPPTYLLAREADVTVLLSVKQKVVANFAYRAGDLNEAAVQQILKGLPKILPVKK